MTTWARTRNSSAYTLLEILLAIGVVAILLGISVPLISGSLGPSPAEEASGLLTTTAQAARQAAIDAGETQRLVVLTNGLQPLNTSLPTAKLPAGWSLRIQRITDAKLRVPAKREVWEFNAAGICEPITLWIGDGRGTSATLVFDPLTAEVLPDE